MTELKAIKSSARKAAVERRDQYHAACPDAGLRLARHIMASADALGLLDASKTVSVFWSMGAEINTGPLLDALGAAGHRTALPVVVAKAQPLAFRAWHTGEPLADGGFGTSIPVPDAETVTPEILFVPLLSFDSAGYRLGYGGGFYDRTLEKLRREAAGGAQPLAVGIAFSAQQVDTVPRGPYDQPLDWIATETGLMRIRSDAPL
ncbi:MAG: 5-formyltetrahydrofolate cyclo-ligase [Rhodospirillales bacterium]